MPTRMCGTHTQSVILRTALRHTRVSRRARTYTAPYQCDCVSVSACQAVCQCVCVSCNRLTESLSDRAASIYHDENSFERHLKLETREA